MNHLDRLTLALIYEVSITEACMESALIRGECLRLLSLPLTLPSGGAYEQDCLAVFIEHLASKLRSWQSPDWTQEVIGGWRTWEVDAKMALIDRLPHLLLRDEESHDVAIALEVILEDSLSMLITPPATIEQIVLSPYWARLSREAQLAVFKAHPPVYDLAILTMCKEMACVKEVECLVFKNSMVFEACRIESLGLQFQSWLDRLAAGSLTDLANLLRQHLYYFM